MIRGFARILTKSKLSPENPPKTKPFWALDSFLHDRWFAVEPSLCMIDSFKSSLSLPPSKWKSEQGYRSLWLISDNGNNWHCLRVVSGCLVDCPREAAICNHDSLVLWDFIWSLRENEYPGLVYACSRKAFVCNMIAFWTALTFASCSGMWSKLPSEHNYNGGRPSSQLTKQKYTLFFCNARISGGR